MLVSSLALSWTVLAAVATVRPVVTPFLIPVVSPPLPAAAPPLPAVPPVSPSSVPAVTPPPVSSGAGEGAVAPPVLREPPLQDGPVLSLLEASLVNPGMVLSASLE